MKKFILITVTVLLILAGLGGCRAPAPSGRVMEQNITSFNLKTSQFYDEFVTLQIERIRLAQIAQEEEDIIPFLNQMLKIQKQAEKICDILNELYLLASEIEEGEGTTSTSFFLATPVLAKGEHSMARTIFGWIPGFQRLVDGYDGDVEGIRLGIYKAYQRIMTESEQIEKETIKEVFKEAGFNKPEDIFYCPAEKMTELYKKELRATTLFSGGLPISEFDEEIRVAKREAVLGKAALLGVVDSILAVTSGDVPTPEILGDLEDYLKTVLGEETAMRYLEGKFKSSLVETGFEMLEESVTGAEKPQEKVTIAVKNEVQDIVTGVLAGQIESSEMPPVGARTGMIAGEIQPYEDWTEEEKRAVAEKLNELEEPLVVVTKTETEETTTRVSVPEGEWDVLSTVEETVPVLVEDAEVKEDVVTQIVRMTVTILELVENHRIAMEELNQSKALEPGEVWDWESWERARETSSALTVKAENTKIMTGETTTLTVTIPEGFDPPFTITGISEGGAGGAIGMPSTVDSRIFTGQFISSNAGTFAIRVQITDANGKVISGGTTISVEAKEVAIEGQIKLVGHFYSTAPTPIGVCQNGRILLKATVSGGDFVLFISPTETVGLFKITGYSTGSAVVCDKPDDTRDLPWDCCQPQSLTGDITGYTSDWRQGEFNFTINEGTPDWQSVTGRFINENEASGGFWGHCDYSPVIGFSAHVVE